MRIGGRKESGKGKKTYKRDEKVQAHLDTGGGKGVTGCADVDNSEKGETIKSGRNAAVRPADEKKQFCSPFGITGYLASGRGEVIREKRSSQVSDFRYRAGETKDPGKSTRGP